MDDARAKRRERSAEAPAMAALPPARVAELVEEVGVRKAELGLIPLLSLAVLAGVFIALGGMFFTISVSGSELGVGPTRVLGGLAFSLGLILVILGGAELFTGNALMVVAWADGAVSGRRLLRNWGWVYLGNFVGAAGAVALMAFSGALAIGGSGETARQIAEAKVALPPVEAFFRGVLCNLLVCVAVWMASAARAAAGKILAILWPIAAFVALGFEHSVANMYLIPIGAMQPGAEIGVGDLLANLIPVTLGNVVGGGALVAAAYWLIYRWSSGGRRRAL